MECLFLRVFKPKKKKWYCEKIVIVTSPVKQTLWSLIVIV